jgi:hypothetical protein
MVSADSSVLVDAKTYSDASISSLRTDMVNADSSVLVDAKTYSDASVSSLRTDMVSADSSVLVDAKTYSDASISSLKIYGDNNYMPKTNISYVPSFVDASASTNITGIEGNIIINDNTFYICTKSSYITIDVSGATQTYSATWKKIDMTSITNSPSMLS